MTLVIGVSDSRESLRPDRAVGRVPAAVSERRRLSVGEALI